MKDSIERPADSFLLGTASLLLAVVFGAVCLVRPLSAHGQENHVGVGSSKPKKKGGFTLAQHLARSPIKMSRKIAIHPVPPTDGVSAGLVVAYGHVIPPPYKFEYVDRRLFLNGIQITPSLVEEREKPTTATSLSADQIKKLHSLKDVEAAAHELYWAEINVKPLATVQSDVLELINGSTVFDKSSEWVGKNSLMAHTADTKMGYLIEFPNSRPVTQSRDGSQREEEDRSRKAREDDLAVLKKGLGKNSLMIFTSSGGRATLFGDPRARVNQIMSKTDTTREQKIESLKDQIFGSYEPALDILDNYDAAEWKVKVGP